MQPRRCAQLLLARALVLARTQSPPIRGNHTRHQPGFGAAATLLLARSVCRCAGGRPGGRRGPWVCSLGGDGPSDIAGGRRAAAPKLPRSLLEGCGACGPSPHPARIGQGGSFAFPTRPVANLKSCTCRRCRRRAAQSRPRAFRKPGPSRCMPKGRFSFAGTGTKISAPHRPAAGPAAPPAVNV